MGRNYGTIGYEFSANAWTPYIKWDIFEQKHTESNIVYCWADVATGFVGALLYISSRNSGSALTHSVLAMT